LGRDRQGIGLETDGSIGEDAVKLNLGCGNRKLSGWVNVDSSPGCNPDQLVDLEQMPWPWPDGSVEEVLLSHVLEHLGRSTELYLAIIKELYRVCANGAKVVIIVPHPRHDFYLNDPTHVRPVTPEGLAHFSQKINRKWISGNAANTPLGVYLGIDFDIVNSKHTLDELWLARMQRGQISNAELEQAARQFNNVIMQTTIELKAVKETK
jgi:predicted SAM-dependent methyltransferase